MTPHRLQLLQVLLGPDEHMDGNIYPAVGSSVDINLGELRRLLAQQAAAQELGRLGDSLADDIGCQPAMDDISGDHLAAWRAARELQRRRPS